MRKMGGVGAGGPSPQTWPRCAGRHLATAPQHVCRLPRRNTVTAPVGSVPVAGKDLQKDCSPPVYGSASHTELGCVEGRAARLAFRIIAGIYPLMPQETPCVCSTLRRATRAVTAMYDAALAPSGLRITQFSVLVVLGRLGPLPVTRLAAEVALDRSTMGRNLDPLERRGLVRIKAGDVDQRERVAHLTAAGERAIETARPHWRAAQERIATLVPPFAIRSLADQLDALRPT
jgi:DNA-binding MarR family transcriptional regulator